MAGSARALHLADLDDATLQHILSFLHPHPDLFRVAASCRRLRDLALDRRSWLVVCHTPQEPVVGIPRQYRKTFLTLQDAISASRPGDTIVIAPGEPHRVSGVVVPWPLHIMGGGTTPEQTVLLCPRGVGTALDFRASARLANLTVLSRLGCCVTHRRGRLAIEGCCLRCEAEGLDHLVSPIATLATSCPAVTMPPSPLPAAAAAAPARSAAADSGAEEVVPYMGQPRGGEQCQQKGLVKRGKRYEQGVQQLEEHRAGAGREQGEAAAFAMGKQAGGPEAAAAAGPGLLAVVESKITGGGMAIRTQGTGSLRSVRVIYESSATLFWFDVDSSIPGTAQQRQPQQSHPLAAGEAGRRSGGGSSSGSAAGSRKRGWPWGPTTAGDESGLLPHGMGARGAGAVATQRPRHAVPAGGVHSSTDPASASMRSMAPSTPAQALPAWMQRPPFDPLAFQRQVRTQMFGARQQYQDDRQPYGGSEEGGEEQQQQQQLQQQQGDVEFDRGQDVPGASERLAEELLDKKAEQWSRHHAAAVAGEFL